MDNNFTTTTPPVVPPEETKPPNFRNIGKQVAEGTATAVVESGIGMQILGFVTKVLATWVSCFLHIATTVIVFFARIIIRGENMAEDAMAEVSRTMVSDLMGVDVPKEALRRRNGKGVRSPVVNEIGEVVLAGLFDAFGNNVPTALKPSDEGVKKVINTVVGMTVEGAIEGGIISTLSAGWLAPMTDLDDNLARAMGFGRLTTRAVRPAIDILVTTPYEWQLNKQYRPKQLTAAQEISRHLQGRITRDQCHEELARMGYSDARIDFLIADATNKIGLSDIAFLVRNSYWTKQTGIDALVKLGWTAADAGTVLEVERLKRIDAVKQDLISAVTQAFVDRDVDTDYYDRTVTAAGMEPEVKVFAKQAAALRRESKRVRMGDGDAETAVKKGYKEFQWYVDYLSERGMVDDDIITKRFLLQDEIREDVEAEAKRKKLDAQRDADRKARQLAAAQRQAELDAKRSHSQVSIAQVERLFIRGRMTLDQYQAFLVQQGYKAADVTLLVNAALLNKDDYQRGVDARTESERRSNVTSLSGSQLEKAVEEGILTVVEYGNILRQEGTTDDDIAIITKMLELNLRERADAKKRRDQAAAELEKKGLSLAQFELAVRRGYRSLGEYIAFLDEQGYGVEDRETLAGLLQDVIDQDTEAQKRRDKAAADAAISKLPIADTERAVRRGLRPMADYTALLARLSYSPADVRLLVDLLKSEISDDAAVAQRKGEIAARLKANAVSLPNLERAVVLGIIDIDRYAAALAENGVAGSDADILLALLQQRVDEADAARVQKAAAEARMQNKPVTLGDLARGVKAGYRTFDQYQAAVAAEGFSLDAQQLMVQLLRDEKEQYDAALQRRKELDSTSSPRELSRADLERAIKTGLRPFIDYYPWLVSQGYDELDQGTLAQLLADELG